LTNFPFVKNEQNIAVEQNESSLRLSGFVKTSLRLDGLVSVSDFLFGRHVIQRSVGNDGGAGNRKEKNVGTPTDLCCHPLFYNNWNL